MSYLGSTDPVSYKLIERLTAAREAAGDRRAAAAVDAALRQVNYATDNARRAIRKITGNLDQVEGALGAGLGCTIEDIDRDAGELGRALALRKFAWEMAADLLTQAEICEARCDGITDAGLADHMRVVHHVDLLPNLDAGYRAEHDKARAAYLAAARVTDRGSDPDAAADAEGDFGPDGTFANLEGDDPR